MSELKHFNQSDLARARELFARKNPGNAVHHSGSGGVSPTLCDSMRSMYRSGDYSIRDISTQKDRNHETVRYHIRGQCQCDGNSDPVAERHNHRSGGRNTTQEKVTPDLCAHLRRSVSGTGITALAESLDINIDRRTVGTHVRGQCNCQHDEPPRIRKWVKDD